ncbi:MAG: polymer-forming cytoskeletal protein [Candidatus Bipolaricaulia bacterium]
MVNERTESNDHAERAKIAGVGRISGGTYESVKVSGSGVVDGDVSAGTIGVAGSCKINGSARADEIKTAGSCRVKGEVRAEELRTSGSCAIDGAIAADTLKCSGSQRVDDSVNAGYVKISGSIRVKGNLETDRFVSEGSFRVEGLLSGDEVAIQLGGNCQAQEIGGERIEVRSGASRGFDPEEGSKHAERQSRDDPWTFREMGLGIDVDWRKMTREMSKLGSKLGNLGLSMTGIGGHGTLRADAIEGDEIYLESTQAKLVRGKRVLIGPDCEIERVEYEDEIRVHDQADVAETAQT